MSEKPDFGLEQQRLAQALLHIRRLIDNWGTTPLSGGDEWADAVLLGYQELRVENLWAALRQPYFGRLDFLEEDHEHIEEFYIGRAGLQLDDLRIVDWRAPFASLFYLKHRAHAAYKAPTRTIEGEIFLKRHLDIDRGELRRIVDELDRRPRADGQPVEADEVGVIDPDDYLLMVLEGRRGEGLQDIVATIQEQQNDLIRLHSDQVTVIQGVAGSGKTSVALHRIAYLLYPQEGARPLQLERMLVIGSNAVFLSFLQEVLPGLGIQNLPQTTFTQWARQRLMLPAELAVTDRTLDVILDRALPRAERAAAYQRSRLKGSLHMRELIDACAEAYRADFNPPPDGIIITPKREGSLDLSYRVPAAFLRSTYEAERNGSDGRVRAVHEHRRHLVDAITRYIMDDHGLRYRERGRELVGRVSRGDGTAEQRQRWGELVKGYRGNPEPVLHKLQMEVNRLVRLDLNRCWPMHTPLSLYDRLLTEMDFLQRVAPLTWSAEDLVALRQTTPPGEDLRIEDLAPLMYLHSLIEERRAIPAPYDHIVVDEAQDLSPFQVWLLHRTVGHNSMTILGDLAQSIHSYRGITAWEQLHEAVGGDFEYAEMPRSYRSTHEIITFANGIISSLNRRTRHRYALADPFPRHGEPVRVERIDEEQTWLDALRARSQEMYSRGYQRIAIICKDAPECEHVHTEMAQYDPTIELLTRPEQKLESGTIIVPVHLTKGLEFEGCIIANASAGHFGETELDGRLLYVAATRALHELAVYSLGDPSPHLLPSG